MPRGVLIVYPYDNLHTNPTMRLLLGMLREEWDRVDVYCSSGDLAVKAGRGGELPLVPQRPRSARNPVTSGGTRTERLVHMGRSFFAPELFSLNRRSYSLVIGVDPEGLVLAHRLARRGGRPLAYVSFEIMFRQEVEGTPEAALKERELTAAAGVSLVLVQDEERAEALARENSFSPSQMVLVPNAPAPETVPPSDLLRERLGISTDRKIVLHSGTLKAWSSRELMEDMVSFWPREYVLVLHNRHEPTPLMRNYLERIAGGGRVFVFPEPLPAGELTSLYGSADFGLAPYKPTPQEWTTGKNIYHIGLSSGKVGYYAMCGLPILASDLPVFSREFARYRCGAVYSRISETGDLLARLDRDYETCRSEALRFYRERLDPLKPMRRFCDRLKEMAG